MSNGNSQLKKLGQGTTKGLLPYEENVQDVLEQTENVVWYSVYPILIPKTDVFYRSFRPTFIIGLKDKEFPVVMDIVKKGLQDVKINRRRKAMVSHILKHSMSVVNSLQRVIVLPTNQVQDYLLSGNPPVEYCRLCGTYHYEINAHVSKAHNPIWYYNEYVQGMGTFDAQHFSGNNCENEGCKNKTPFVNIHEGYRKYCSQSCYQEARGR